MAEAHEIVRVYDGGWPAQSSNLGHALHARDFLFDRKDLVTHDMSDLGQLITGAEYSALQKHFNAEVGKVQHCLANFPTVADVSHRIVAASFSSFMSFLHDFKALLKRGQ
jgi:hypothetical protein